MSMLFISKAASLTLKGTGSTAVQQVRNIQSKTKAMTLSESAFASLNPQYSLIYESVGSGVGIHHLRNNKETYKFAMSEKTLQDSDYINDPSFQFTIPGIFIHFNAYAKVGSISVVSNIPELLNLKQNLRLNQKTLVQIFENTITHWNDNRITSLNPTIIFPNQPIRRIVRKGVSGTTLDFTNGLQHFDASWTEVSSNPTWPNEASDPNFLKVESSKVTTEMINIDYSISYLQDEATGCSVSKYAVEIQNADGNYVLANTTTTSAAIDSIGVNFDSRFTADFLNPTGYLSYPINSVTYFIYRSKTNDTDCSQQIALYVLAKTFIFSTAGNAIVRATLKEPLAVHSSILSKMQSVLSKMECSETLIPDFFMTPNYDTFIVGAVSGFVGAIFLILLSIVFVLLSTVCCLWIKKRYNQKYYENLIH
eukprot:gene2618-3578_t